MASTLTSETAEQSKTYLYPLRIRIPHNKKVVIYIKSSITKEGREALHNLKKDNNHMILTADKGVALVVVDKDMYIEKCMTLLSDQGVYQECKDLIKSIHNKVRRQHMT